MFTKIFITPVDFDCNLSCDYCYNTTNDCRQITRSYKTNVIDGRILTRIFESIKPYIQNRLTIIWHGGEPLLAGKSFYRRADQEIKRILGDAVIVDYGLQTNATLVDEEWCILMKELKIKPSTSLGSS